MDQYLQGVSIKLQLSLTDENDEAGHLALLSAIEVTVINEATLGTLKSGTYAEGKVKYSSAASGIIYFYVENTLTTGAAKGVYAAIVTITKANTDFTNSVQVMKKRENVFEIV